MTTLEPRFAAYACICVLFFGAASSAGAQTSCGDPHVAGVPARLSNDPASSQFPSVAWNGDFFGVVWRDRRDGNSEIYFARVGPDGRRRGLDVRVTNDPAESLNPVIAWNGTRFGVAWRDERDGNPEIYFSLLDPDGIRAVADTRLTDAPEASSLPSIAWNGTEFGIAWRDQRHGNGEIYFCRVSQSGTKTGIDVRVTNDPAGSYTPSVAWGDGEWGIAWHDTRFAGDNEVLFVRLSTDGMKLGDDKRVTNSVGVSSRTALVWAGDGWGLAWSDDRGGESEILFSRLAPDGNVLGPERRITTAAGASERPSLAWTGTEYGVVWYDARDGGQREIYFARLDAAGIKVGEDLRVTYDPALSQNATIAWTGDRFGLTWDDARIPEAEIYAAIIGCTCVDPDSDGVLTCESDNCPAIANAAQLDSDGDGFGDPCDCGPDNSALSPGAFETCSDLLDNDCDGWTDVADSECRLMDPDGLAFSSRSEITWERKPAAETYGLFTGRIRNTGMRDYSHFCAATLIDGSAVAEVRDVPSPGEAIYVLVTGLKRNATDGTIQNGDLGVTSDGLRRPQGFVRCAERVYVKADAPGTQEGTSWTDAFHTITDACAGRSHAEIWISGGVVDTTTDHRCHGSGYVMYGGFRGTENRPWQRDTALYPTHWRVPRFSLSGNLVFDGVWVEGIDPFTLLGNFVYRAEFRRVQFIGGSLAFRPLRFQVGYLVIEDSLFDNASIFVGYEVRADILIRRNRMTAIGGTALRLFAQGWETTESIRGEVSENYILGGGIQLEAEADNDPEYEHTGALIDVVFANNVVSGAVADAVSARVSTYQGQDGEAIDASIRARFISNTISDAGGHGLSCSATLRPEPDRTDATASCNLELWNNLITFTGGAGVWEGSDAQYPDLMSTDATLHGNAFWNNVGGVYFDEGTTALDVGGVNGLPGNDSNACFDPIYVNRTERDYRLWASSMAIDGSSSGSPFQGPLDVAGRPRVLDGNGDGVAVPDQGAHER